MTKTKIEWCDRTWNPVAGCLHGCDYCYARRIAHRFDGKRNWRTDEEYRVAGVTTLNPAKIPVPWLPLPVFEAYPYGFYPTFHQYKLDEPQKIKKPQTIFVGSMTDLFGEWVPDEWIQMIFQACECAPQHRYMFLTKNPKRYYNLMERQMLPTAHWYGATISNSNMPYFAAKDYKTFWSVEPMQAKIYIGVPTPDLVIIGAETGNRKNKIVPQKDWIEFLVDTCDRCEVPVFMKESIAPIIGEENMRRELPWEGGV